MACTICWPHDWAVMISGQRCVLHEDLAHSDAHLLSTILLNPLCHTITWWRSGDSRCLATFLWFAAILNRSDWFQIFGLVCLSDQLCLLDRLCDWLVLQHGCALGLRLCQACVALHHRSLDGSQRVDLRLRAAVHLRPANVFNNWVLLHLWNFFSDWCRDSRWILASWWHYLPLSGRSLPDAIHGHQLHRQLPVENSLSSLRAQHLCLEWLWRHKNLTRVDNFSRWVWPWLLSGHILRKYFLNETLLVLHVDSAVVAFLLHFLKGSNHVLADSLELVLTWLRLDLLSWLVNLLLACIPLSLQSSSVLTHLHSFA